MYGTADSAGRDSDFSHFTISRRNSICETCVKKMVADHSPIHIHPGISTAAWMCGRNSDCASTSETGVCVLHNRKHNAGNDSSVGGQWNQQRPKRNWRPHLAGQQAFRKSHE